MRDAEVKCHDGVVVKGIVMNSERTPLDECAHAYKSLDAVLNVLAQEEIAQVVHRVFPVANLKGLD